jgi:hypothetical protein
VFVTGAPTWTSGLTPTNYPAIDGLTIRGGDQAGFPGNINQLGGGKNGQPANVTAQGGGIWVNTSAAGYRITNNVLQSNGGSYGGAIRLGTPQLRDGQATRDAPYGQPVERSSGNVQILNNRIINNGGTNLAGAIGIFNGSNNYTISGNDLCGNHSSEYGGAISHYGRSTGGSITGNRLWFNTGYDEGGGIFVSSELPRPGEPSFGAGDVNIDRNTIQANLSNDDGGGIRLLQTGPYSPAVAAIPGGNGRPPVPAVAAVNEINVRNNIIASNISTHEGAGIGVDDAPGLNIIDDTVVKNITTATAMTSNGQPAPAGLSVAEPSIGVQARYPLILNSVFADNRAGSFTPAGVVGIGATGDATPINYLDIGVAQTGNTTNLHPVGSVFQTLGGYTPDATDKTVSGIAALHFVNTSYDVGVSVAALRANPGFRLAQIVAVDTAPSLMGNFHLKDTGSAARAYGRGTAAVAALPAVGLVPAVPATTYASPNVDIDNQARPAGVAARPDSGADQFGTIGSPAPGTVGGPVILDTFNRTTGLIETAHPWAPFLGAGENAPQLPATTNWSIVNNQANAGNDASGLTDIIWPTWFNTSQEAAMQLISQGGNTSNGSNLPVTGVGQSLIVQAETFPVLPFFQSYLAQYTEVRYTPVSNVTTGPAAGRFRTQRVDVIVESRTTLNGSLSSTTIGTKTLQSNLNSTTVGSPNFGPGVFTGNNWLQAKVLTDGSIQINRVTGSTQNANGQNSGPDATTVRPVLTVAAAAAGNPGIQGGFIGLQSHATSAATFPRFDNFFGGNSL